MKPTGSPRYFQPVCVRTAQGFIGGPSGYREVSEEEARDAGPLVIDATENVGGSLSTDTQP